MVILVVVVVFDEFSSVVVLEQTVCLEWEFSRPILTIRPFFSICLSSKRV